MGRRGYIPEDHKQFTGKQLELLQKAADEVRYLLDRGYDVKPVTTFIGNHYIFSERQRLALARSVASAVSAASRTYRIIEQTQTAVSLLLEHLKFLNIKRACFYLDAPVSNSGRLAGLIRQCAEETGVLADVRVIADVDRTLERLDGVVSGDAIILDRCGSWLNLMPEIVKQLEDVWIISL